MRPHDDLGPSLDQFTNFWWGELAKKVDGAMVFLDDPSAECLHWNCGGAEALFKAGAAGVRELSSFESGGKECRKGVFVTSRAVLGATEMAVRDVVLGSRFEHVVVVTAAPATAHVTATRLEHHDDDPNNLRAFEELENRMLRWMGNNNYTAEVLYCPLFAAQLLEDVFIMPAFADLSPSPSAQGTTPEPVDKRGLVGAHSRVHHLAACLHSLMSFLGAREEVFSMGGTAASLAAELDALPAARARRKTAERKVAVLLVDRGLDLASACSLDTSGCLLDRVLTVLPTFPGHSAERSVDMSSLCSAAPVSSPDLPTPLAPGCALQPAGLSCLLEARSTKEGLMALQRRFLEVSPGSATLRVTPDSLTKRARALAKEKGLKSNAALLQQCLGVLQSLTGPESARLELLAGLQKVLVQNLAIGGSDRGLADVITQVTSLLKSRKERGLEVESVLLLLLQAFSLAGPDQASLPGVQQEADRLREALATALMEEGGDQDAAWPGLMSDEAHASRVAGDIVHRLFDIARARQHLSRYREVLHRPSTQQPAEVVPLLPRLLADCLDPSRMELGPDVISSMSGSLRHTLGMFLSSAKPHPADCPLLICLVLGGVTGAELRSLRSVASQGARRVILGATALISPRDTLAYIKP